MKNVGNSAKEAIKASIMACETRGCLITGNQLEKFKLDTHLIARRLRDK